MKVSTLRRVDRWVGIPLCFLLTLVRRLGERFRAAPAGPVRSILFVKLAEQGSTVLAYPSLLAAVERVGAENVYFLVFEANRDILDAMEVIPPENVITIRTSSVPGALLSALSVLGRMRRLKLDAAIDLEFFARSSAVLTYLSGARRRVGLHAFAGDGPWRGNLMTHRPIYNPHLHTSQLFRLQVDALDQPPERFPACDVVPTPAADLPRGTFGPRPEELERVRGMLREVTGLPEVPRLVLLNPNCSDLLPLRKWDEPSYVALAHRLLDHDPDLWIALTGAPEDAPGAERLVREIGAERCVSVAGKTTIRELLVLYGLSQVLVTNDSGPAHFASLTTIDVVTLFGPETPRLFGVLSPRSHVVWAETACSPCVNAYNNRVSTCRDNVCMKRITVDEVLGRVVAALAARDREQLVPTPTPAARRGTVATEERGGGAVETPRV